MAITPRPWNMELSRDHKEIYINGNRTIDLVATIDHDDVDLDVATDNAVLICAAPDLLEACKLIKSVTQQTENEPRNQLDRIFDIATAAIAKAEPSEE